MIAKTGRAQRIEKPGLPAGRKNVSFRTKIIRWFGGQGVTIGMNCRRGKGTVFLEGFSVDTRIASRWDRIRIGENSILACRIVLEREQGEVIAGDRTYIGASSIVCADGISVGGDVLIAWGCTIIDHDSHSLDWRERTEDATLWRKGYQEGGLRRAAELKDWRNIQTAPVVIGDKAWIGFNSVILKGVEIGEGAVVAAGSVVTQSIPPWTLAGGNPARKIRSIPKP